jgi:CheY-like chemotaxis protein
MPVKILLADKSITIQKVVEMLFSGKDYEVVCVSDGETALTEAGRVVPDVILADIDLPRVDGYAFAGRLRQMPALAQTPVILMLSRDDVFDQVKAKEVAIVDHIAKPFESQELIGKVKKAGAGGAARPAEQAAAAPATPKSAPAAPRPQVAPAAPPKPAKKAAAPDIFDIIEEAPSQEEVKRSAARSEDESIYEVEPVIEVEEQIPGETAKALPVGQKAVEEMREGLGLGRTQQEADQDIVSFESLDLGTPAAREYQPPRQQEPPKPARREAPKAPAAPAATAAHQASLTESDIWNMAEATVARIAKDMLGTMQPPQASGPSAQELRSMVQQAVAEQGAATAREVAPPQVPERVVQQAVQSAVQEMARDIIEKVAWEVVPDLAATMIREEIERLKALQ